MINPTLIYNDINFQNVQLIHGDEAAKTNVNVIMVQSVMFKRGFVLVSLDGLPNIVILHVLQISTVSSAKNSVVVCMEAPVTLSRENAIAPQGGRVLCKLIYCKKNTNQADNYN